MQIETKNEFGHVDTWLSKSSSLKKTSTSKNIIRNKDVVLSDTPVSSPPPKEIISENKATKVKAKEEHTTPVINPVVKNDIVQGVEIVCGCGEVIRLKFNYDQ